jgi:DNA-binding GntR family transcriptional regulator
MNAGATAERVLKALRLRLMDRDIRPGDRLDPALLTSQLGASATPVREASTSCRAKGWSKREREVAFACPAR